MKRLLGMSAVFAALALAPAAAVGQTTSQVLVIQKETVVVVTLGNIYTSIGKNLPVGHHYFRPYAGKMAGQWVAMTQNDIVCRTEKNAVSLGWRIRQGQSAAMAADEINQAWHEVRCGTAVGRELTPYMHSVRSHDGRFEHRNDVVWLKDKFGNDYYVGYPKYPQL